VFSCLRAELALDADGPASDRQVCLGGTVGAAGPGPAG